MRALRTLHRWIGVAVAAPILLVALSGGLLLLRDPYYRARYPSLARPVAEHATAEYARILTHIERTFEGDRLRLVRFPREGVNAFHVYLDGEGEAFIDASDGRLIARWRTWDDPAAFFFDLHAHLLAGEPGEVLNGLVAVLATGLLATGFVLAVRHLSRGVSARLLPRRRTRGEVLGSHLSVGALVSLPILAFTATGAGLVFYQPLSAALAAVWGADRIPSARVAHEPGRTRADWTVVLATLASTLPDGVTTMYYPGTAANAVSTFRKRVPGESHPNGRSYVLVHPYDGTVLQDIDARAQGMGMRAMHALYPIHAAKIGGGAVVVLAGVSAVTLAWLSVSGVWSVFGWRRRQSQPERLNPTKSAPQAAAMVPSDSG